jgi:hypothetical protein
MGHHALRPLGIVHPSVYKTHAGRVEIEILDTKQSVLAPISKGEEGIKVQPHTSIVIPPDGSRDLPGLWFMMPMILIYPQRPFIGPPG